MQYGKYGVYIAAAWLGHDSATPGANFCKDWLARPKRPRLCARRCCRARSRRPCLILPQALQRLIGRLHGRRRRKRFRRPVGRFHSLRSPRAVDKVRVSGSSIVASIAQTMTTHAHPDIGPPQTPASLHLLQGKKPSCAARCGRPNQWRRAPTSPDSHQRRVADWAAGIVRNAPWLRVATFLSLGLGRQSGE
jgi:hypothetical protein